MPILLLLLGGVAIIAIARAASSSAPPSDHLLTQGGGAGAGGGGGSAPPTVAELTPAEKTALAASVAMRWVSNEKMNVANDADTMDLGAVGVSGEAGAGPVLAGANVQKHLFVLVNDRKNPTKVIVPVSDSAAGKYATSGQWAIFLRPGEATSLFKSVGLDLGDVLTPHVVDKGSGSGGEVKMLGPAALGGVGPLTLRPSPSPSMLDAAASSFNASMDITDLPDGDPATAPTPGGSGTYTYYPLKDIRENYKKYLANTLVHNMTWVSYFTAAASKLNDLGYANARDQAYLAAKALAP